MPHYIIKQKVYKIRIFNNALKFRLDSAGMSFSDGTFRSPMGDISLWWSMSTVEVSDQACRSPIFSWTHLFLIFIFIVSMLCKLFVNINFCDKSSYLLSILSIFIFIVNIHIYCQYANFCHYKILLSKFICIVNI